MQYIIFTTLVWNWHMYVTHPISFISSTFSKNQIFSTLFTRPCFPPDGLSVHSAFKSRAYFLHDRCNTREYQPLCMGYIVWSPVVLFAMKKSVFLVFMCKTSSHISNVKFLFTWRVFLQAVISLLQITSSFYWHYMCTFDTDIALDRTQMQIRIHGISFLSRSNYPTLNFLYAFLLWLSDYEM